MPYTKDKLTDAEREKLSASDFVFPKDRSWPIHDLKHGKIALTWALWPQHKDVAKKVIKAVFARYPELRFTKVGKKCMGKVKGGGKNLYQPAGKQRLAASRSLGTLGDNPVIAERMASLREMLSDADELPEYVHHDPHGIGIEEDGILSSIAETRGRLRRRRRQ